MTFRPGAQIGAYRVIGPYPGGAWRALDIEDHTRVHLDVRETCDDWRERSIQLLRAASLLGSLDHPGIGRILARGVLPDRRPWIASELADGVPLSDILARRTLAIDEALALVRDLAAILGPVHARCLVHGAIHQHAIVMRTGERSFPIQLGGWSELRAAGTDLDEAIPLTPYAAPEAPYRDRADIYAIGVLVYRALTGRFPGHHIEHVAGVPGVVSSLVVRMLARDPTARPDADSLHATTAELTGNRALSIRRSSRLRWTPAPEGERIAPVHAQADARDELD